MLPSSLFYPQALTRNLLGATLLRLMVDDKKRNIFVGNISSLKSFAEIFIVALNANLSRRTSNDAQAVN